MGYKHDEILNVPHGAACVEWTASKTPAGYGSKWSVKHRKTCYVHRLIWEQVHGPIPEGMHVLHRCDNPACYNIDHVFLGTHKDNMVDMTVKGRNKKQKLSVSQVVEIRERLERGEMMTAIAADFGVTRQQIFHIRKGEQWKHLA